MEMTDRFGYRYGVSFPGRIYAEVGKMRKLTGFEHGINFGGWLSQCDHERSTYEGFITEKDFKTVSEWGLDHVRIPIDYKLLETEQGEYIRDNFIYLDHAVAWCRKYGLNMILDLHSTYGFSFDDYEEGGVFFKNEEYQERYYRLWEELAGRYGSNSDMLILELLNEVTEKEYCDPWNRIATECIKRIRAIAPDIKIMFGGYYNNSIEALKDLCEPYDENIVYTFHCYEPLIFTHQGAYWVPTMDTGYRIGIDATYREMKEATEKYMSQIAVGFDELDPEGHFDGEYLDRYFAEAVRVAEERNVPLYCGEYGVIDRADPGELLKWYEVMHESFEKYNIGRAAWTYKALDFGFVDEHMKPVLERVVKLL